MGAFTSEQEAILRGMGKVTMLYIGSVQEVLELGLLRLAALQTLLLTKDMITREELEEAIKENQARAAIEKVFTFGTDLKGLQEAMGDEFNRLLRGEREDQSTQREGE